MKRRRLVTISIVLLISLCGNEVFSQDILSYFDFETSTSRTVLFVNNNLSIEFNDFNKKNQSQITFFHFWMDRKRIH